MRYRKLLNRTVVLLLLIIGYNVFLRYVSETVIENEKTEPVSDKEPLYGNTEHSLFEKENSNEKPEYDNSTSVALEPQTANLKDIEPTLDFPETTDQKSDNFIRDGLTVYEWIGVCTDQLEVLKAYPGFPRYPDIKSNAITLDVILNIESFGLRLFGYLVPETTGEYQFKILPETASTELWLSTDIQANALKLLSMKNNSASDRIRLRGGNPYSIEILTVSSSKLDKLTVYWRASNSESEYEVIVQKFLSQYPTVIAEDMHSLPSHATQFRPNSLKDPRENFPLLHQLSPEKYLNAFPKCSNRSSDLIPKEVLKYKGLWTLNEIKVFLYNMNTNELFDGTHRINETEAEIMVHNFKTAKENLLQEFILLNLEKSIDEVREDRYLVEGNVAFENENYLLTQTLHDINGTFCVPTLTPNLTAFVHIVIIVKDQSRWLKYFFENVNSIYDNTKDKRFGVIIVDFKSGDLDVRESMQRILKIEHYVYIPVDGTFNKVLGQNLAIESVKNPNEIIFTCDLHLDIPINMIDVIRKHTIQGISMFGPILRRLECGELSFVGKGKWEVSGYGLIGMFKSDWKFVGGMSKEYGLKWGGEDWELVDRLLRIGYHIYRVRVPALVHYYHKREGAWYIGT